MGPGSLTGAYRKPMRFALVAFSCVALSTFLAGGSSGQEDDDAAPLTVPKAVCGANDQPETALQGQVPAALRATGFHGFNCNLQLIGQSRGDGATRLYFTTRPGGLPYCAHDSERYRTIGC